MGSEASNFVTQLQAITNFATLLYKFNVVKVQRFKKVIKDPSILTLINILGLDITLTVEMIQNAKAALTVEIIQSCSFSEIRLIFMFCKRKKH